MNKIDSSPKTIATINFKGGVGKTTITWCLGDLLSTTTNNNVLMFDLDAQMSLTQAITLDETTGNIGADFLKWLEKAIQEKRTIFDAIDAFTNRTQKFDFPIKMDFIYEISKQFHFIPSVEDLYWQELEIFDRDSMKDFIRRLLGKITNSNKLPTYNYVLFDCPPSFTLLSYSVLSCCDLILIPVNPDYYAARGTSLILNTLRMRIEPHPIPKIGVFMNKTKTYGNVPTKEARLYMHDVEKVCHDAVSNKKINARFFKSFIRERVGIKRAIKNGIPDELVSDFKNLWTECVEFLNE